MTFEPKTVRALEPERSPDVLQPPDTRHHAEGEGFETQAAALTPAGQVAPSLLAPVQAKAAVQREEASGPAPTRGTMLGWDLWVVPDGYDGQMPTSNWIHASTKARAEAMFAQIEGGASSLKIFESSGNLHGHAIDTAYPGFTAKVLKMLKRLLTTRTGRKIVKDACTGPGIEIRPSQLNVAHAYPDDPAKATGGEGKDKGSSSVVYMDPNLSNKSFVVRDKDGKELAAPVFLILGHELVHAIHNQDGDNATATAGSPGYTNKEEEDTIGDRHDLTENALRKEHGLGVRSGHWARDTGHRSATVSGGATGG